MQYLPYHYQESRVMKAIAEAQGSEVSSLYATLDEILKQFYVETATDWGLDLWEEMLGLKSYAGKPVEQRSSRIISKLRGIGTVTISLIKNVAESYVNGTVEVNEDNTNYSFTVKFVDNLGVPPNLEDLMEAIEEIKPAHLEVKYEYKYLLISDIHEVMTISEIETHPLTDFAPFEPVL
ncbi:MAG: YmfQ family protein [Thermoanaerobacteraceae bacterium]|nr:YmfQ family protein [Thermoanaerobacteraceae bacterium]